MTKTETKKLGDFEFKTTQLPAMRAFALLTRLAKVVGPALGALSTLNPDTELDLAGSGLFTALQTLDPKEAEHLILEVLVATEVVIPDATGGRAVPLSKQENINLVFTGKLKLLFQVLGFALSVNFRDFSEGVDQAAPEAQGLSAS
jgi:hypothetical protein